MNKKQFTLIEILVVVAIIGILASLLLPSLSKARARAKQVTCLNQLKQLGIAMQMYISDDSASYFPYTRISGGSKISWDDLIAGYDGRESMTYAEMHSSIDTVDEVNPLYQCPEDTVKPRNEGAPRRSYGISSYRVANSNVKKSNPGISGGQNDGTDLSRQLTSLSSPTGTIVLSENFNRDNNMGVHWGSITAGNHYSTQTATVSNPLPHFEKFNYLFADGHAKVLNYYGTLLEQLPSDSDARNTMWDAGR
ncbi:type II secretion system protein [Lentisphaera profundi]|uniref:Type II secretion system protein n=1 Tax=Lentisphaera profundi TaxID=1658616 RepID=A0ABY7VZP6_9BACT|nr:type II secretion system protein [Lentisphaera profundi]WDE99421.1 type II secretion system protein [Lentisphaera profundi]